MSRDPIPEARVLLRSSRIASSLALLAMTEKGIVPRNDLIGQGKTPQAASKKIPP